MVTGVVDAKLWVFVGGRIRWSWTNWTRAHDDGDWDDDVGGGGVDGITYDWWCDGKKGVDWESTYVDEDFV